MIECENVCFSYTKDRPSLKNISCTIKKGSFVLLCGPSGCGKTTLTRLFNGLIPHYYNGALSGKITYMGQDYTKFSLFDLSARTGSVFQNPRSQFFNVDTTSELAFGPENHGLPKNVIANKVNRIVKQLDLEKLMNRSIFQLSGGEKQKIACGSAGAIDPEIYVFDEPSSNLDSDSIYDLRDFLIRLKESGKTIIIAEHRLYYLCDLADQVIYMKDGAIKKTFTGESFMHIDAREREDMGLRPLTLADLPKTDPVGNFTGEECLKLSDLSFSYRSSHKNVLDIDSLSFEKGSVTAVIGHNGAGKSTFSRCLCGLEKHCRGTVTYNNKKYRNKDRLRLCYMVMQDVNHQLFTESVREEILLSMDQDDPQLLHTILEQTDLTDLATCHPMGLSGGQKQRVAVASAIASHRPVILFDEPTSGLDLFHMRRTAKLIRQMAASGKTIIIITHDPEFILRCCTHVVHLEHGQVVENYPLKDESSKKSLLDFFNGTKGETYQSMKKCEKKSPSFLLKEWGRPYSMHFIISILFAIMGVACHMIPYFCIIDVIDKMFHNVTSFEAYLPSCMIAALSYGGKVLFSNISTMFSHKAAYMTLCSLRKKIIEKMIRLPMGKLLNTPSAVYKTTIVDRIETMEIPFAHVLPEMISNMVVPLFIVIYLFVLDWRMALLSIATIISGMFIMSLGMKNYAEDGAGALAATEKMTDSVVEYIGGIEVVKAFSQSAGSYKKYARAVKNNGRYYIDWMKRSQKTMCTYNAVIPSVLLFVLPGGMLLWNMGSIDTLTFISSIIFSLGITGPVMESFSFASSLAMLSKNTSEINDILESPELVHGTENVDLKDLTINFKDVSFSYDQKDEVLHQVNLTIPQGQMAAFAGPSGSGKSTIARLIAGYWDISSGQITIGNVDVKNIPSKQLSSLISYVSQDNFLFNRSIRENIRMGNPDATDEQVEQAAIKSGCDEFIRSLEKGYDTIAGSGGTQLSGGERQRIAIARAMLKDAPIVILDEATAFIDPENESLIQNAISRLTRGKTLIVIAHRLSTIVDARKIFVINNGTVSCSGTHSELLETCSLYQTMWQAHMDARDEA